MSMLAGRLTVQKDGKCWESLGFRAKQQRTNRYAANTCSLSLTEAVFMDESFSSDITTFCIH